MDLSDFRPKSAFSMILSGKCENVRNLALFRSKTHFCVFFAPKRKKPALARNLAVANAFLVILGAVFAKKRKRADFAVLGDFSTFGRRNLLFRPKSGKSGKYTEIAKSRFSAEAPNPLKHKHLGTFLEPETHKCAFSTFGLTFPSWSVFGAKSAPEVENKQNFTFFVPRVENRVFAILVEKRCPEPYVYQGFHACRRKSKKLIFRILVVFSISCCAQKSSLVAFYFTEKQFSMKKHSSPKGLFFLREINDFGSQNRPGSFFAPFAVKP